MIIRCPSGSEIKLSAINAALREVYADNDFKVTSFPVELQGRSDLDINAEPEGKEQTLEYARERLRQMCLQHGPTPGIDISIESGIIDGLDVACVVISTQNGESALSWSQGVTVPEGALEKARARGLKTTSVGDIIHEKHPEIPANNWEGSFPPYISRQQQIQAAVISALHRMPAI